MSASGHGCKNFSLNLKKRLFDYFVLQKRFRCIEIKNRVAGRFYLCQPGDHSVTAIEETVIPTAVMEETIIPATSVTGRLNHNTGHSWPGENAITDTHHGRNRFTGHSRDWNIGLECQPTSDSNIPARNHLETIQQILKKPLYRPQQRTEN